jgi:hypothetical protein
MYAKSLVAAVLAGLYALYAALEGDGGQGMTNQEWAGVAIAAVGALAVWAVPNAPRSVDTRSRDTGAGGVL